MKKQAITLGRIGVLLPIAMVIPFLGAVAGLATVVLLLISHYYLSKIYEKPEIFKKALSGTIIMIAGSIVGGILLAVGIGTAVFASAEGGPQFSEYQEIIGQIFGSAISIVGFIIMFATAIIGVYFIFKSLTALGAQSNINLFKTAGLLYFIGIITSVIFIGALVMFVGWILHIVAYFSIQPDKEPA